MADVIAYREGYKYQLAETYSYQVPERYPPILAPIITEFLTLTGRALTILKAYAWDGPSGPTIDTPDSLRGSLVHDALYQLIRLGFLPANPWRLYADEMLQEILLQDNMDPARAALWYKMVRRFAGSAAHPSAERPVLYAPRPVPTQPIAESGGLR